MFIVSWEQDAVKSVVNIFFLSNPIDRKNEWVYLV